MHTVVGAVIPEQVRPGLLPTETLWVKDLLEYAFIVHSWLCLKRSAQMVHLFLSMFFFAVRPHFKTEAGACSLWYWQHW